MNSRQKGVKGEERAAHFLEANGYTIVERNFTSRKGEIDVIAVRGDDIVFAEVKTWDAFDALSLEYSINARKKKRIHATSKMYLMKKPQYKDYRLHFNVIFLSDKSEDVHCIENAF